VGHPPQGAVLEGSGALSWRLSDRADAEARVLADVHYSRQKPGTPQFVPPGRALVLKCEGAYWVTSWPYAEYVKHRWGGAWVCSAFRRERHCQERASDLIKAAVAATRWYWRHGGNPKWDEPEPCQVVTFVDPDKVLPKTDYGRRSQSESSKPGRCFIKAGFEPDGCTVDRQLSAFVLPCTSYPDAAAPLPASSVSQTTWLEVA
jgi:hypothetical protein